MKILRYYAMTIIGLTLLGLFADFFDNIEPGDSITAIVLYAPILFYLVTDNHSSSNTKDKDIN